MKEIQLSQGRRAMVDDEDEERILALGKWHAHVIPRKDRETVYAQHTVATKTKPRKFKQILLHRFILGINDSSIKIDHKEMNGLNCQKDNLRVATATQNHQNRVKMSRNGKPPASLFKGVSLNNGKWLSRISVYGTRVHLGMFNFEIEAAAAYDSAAVEHHKEFAVLNLKLRRER